MTTDTTSHSRAARNAYERGRLRSSLWKAAIVTTPIALFALLSIGRSASVMIPFVFAMWIFAQWRGSVFLRGAFYGAGGGVVTSLLPVALLRPCCVGRDMASMGADCCTMPGACMGVGMAIGVLFALFVPFGKSAWWRAAGGVALGLASVALLRCTTLFVGEAVGLVAGLMAGAVATMAGRALVKRSLRA